MVRDVVGLYLNPPEKLVVVCVELVKRRLHRRVLLPLLIRAACRTRVAGVIECVVGPNGSAGSP